VNLEETFGFFADLRAPYIASYVAFLEKHPDAQCETLVDDAKVFGARRRTDTVEHPYAIPEAAYESVGFELSGVKVGAERFRWDHCPIQVVRKAPIDAILGPWFEEWIETNREPLEPQLQNVIHSVTVPQHAGGVWRFTVDFGSASLEGLLQLMLRLSGTETQSVVIGVERELVPAAPRGKRAPKKAGPRAAAAAGRAAKPHRRTRK
jgi:hypothetical protein